MKSKSKPWRIFLALKVLEIIGAVALIAAVWIAWQGLDRAGRYLYDNRIAGYGIGSDPTEHLRDVKRDVRLMVPYHGQAIMEIRLDVYGDHCGNRVGYIDQREYNKFSNATVWSSVDVILDLELVKVHDRDEYYDRIPWTRRHGLTSDQYQGHGVPDDQLIGDVAYTHGIRMSEYQDIGDALNEYVAKNFVLVALISETRPPPSSYRWIAIRHVLYVALNCVKITVSTAWEYGWKVAWFLIKWITLSAVAIAVVTVVISVIQWLLARWFRANWRWAREIEKSRRKIKRKS